MSTVYLSWDAVPSGEYSILLADPPWHYDTWSPRGEGKCPQAHYRTLTIDEICALPVARIAAEDAVLFLWIPFCHVFRAKAVIRAWGFKFSAFGFIWCKLTSTGKRWHFGLGQTTRQQAEPLLIARRGHCVRRQDRGVPQIVEAPVRGHSRKPDCIYGLVERLYGDLPRIELFARQLEPGWDVVGDEATKFSSEAQEGGRSLWQSSQSRTSS